MTYDFHCPRCRKEWETTTPLHYHLCCPLTSTTRRIVNIDSTPWPHPLEQRLSDWLLHPMFEAEVDQ